MFENLFKLSGPKLVAFFATFGCLFFGLGCFLSGVLTSDVHTLAYSGQRDKMILLGLLNSAETTKKEEEKAKQNQTTTTSIKLEDWFTPTRVRLMRKQGLTTCPYWEDICVYNQQFYVHNQSNTFELKYAFWDILGQLVDISRSVELSNEIFESFFRAKVWNETTNEYARAECTYHPVMNHMIIEDRYMTMLGEFFIRVMRFMYYYYEQAKLFDENMQLWVIMQDDSPLFTFHHLFLEKYSHHSVQHIDNMLNHLSCRCFHRLFMCGFKLQYNSTSDTNWIQPWSNPTFETQRLFPATINTLNAWVDRVDIYLQRDTLKYKIERLKTRHDDNSMSVPVSLSQHYVGPDKWRLIGFYQRKVRRQWVNLATIIEQCNQKYNRFFIACDIVLLEGYLHSRDVVIKHRIFDMLVGIHGAHLQDAVWMKQNGSYIIELMPFDAAPWSSNLHEPTLVGMTFWNTQFNYVGLQLPNDSIVWSSQWEQKRQDWSRRNFRVDWHTLSDVIDFLMVEKGGICNVFKSGAHVQVPKHIRDYGFAVFNAFCPGDERAYHQTKEKIG
ncbi:hypothetical protein RFI_19332 [Reticulomyxa filosa]|uniref:Uncharacterized protein n=1 Tax=Reticulomyxa filosa TaxID=46433 RepID=X6MVX0_RETFI|nr:hypothetical protein RFI_19332 [Reticulomyxa filosa]|eukprot:ETO17969.1 hypothetical protein RFI_19332 [Reticulomyxa filosa]